MPLRRAPPPATPRQTHSPRRIRKNRHNMLRPHPTIPMARHRRQIATLPRETIRPCRTQNHRIPRLLRFTSTSESCDMPITVCTPAYSSDSVLSLRRQPCVFCISSVIRFSFTALVYIRFCPSPNVPIFSGTMASADFSQFVVTTSLLTCLRDLPR